MAEINSVCIFCGSSGRVDDTHKEAASEIGRRLAERGMTLVYGGGRVGLMGLAADAALAAGGRVVGVIPEHIQALEVEHTGLTELHVVDTMHTRKRRMFDLSDAFVVLPGGLGTLDETFEILTWKQLALHDKPVVLLNRAGYWTPLLRLVDAMIDAGFCRPEHRGLFRVAETIDAVFTALALAPEPRVPPESKWA